MCGINLTFGQSQIECMNAALSHRGIRSTITPFWDNPNHQTLFLGHVRLPIQGLDKRFDHPHRIQNFYMAFVGEFLNFREFSKKAESDLPVLMEQLLNNDTGFLHQVDGFFAIILIDEKDRKIYVMTDPLAKKPLYMREDVFGISSEVKALTNLAPVTPDELYFSAVKKWGYCPEPRTPFMQIRKFPPGAFVIIGEDGKTQVIQPWKAWQPRVNAVECLRDDLRIAVKNRMVSDVPISLLMSGGLDSTIIYYLMREFTSSINVFHIDNEEAQYLEYIDFRPQDNVTKLTIDQSSYDLENILYMNDGPVDLGSVVPQYLLSKAIHEQGFKVCLSGDGADELFGGYRRAMEYDSQHSDIFHELVLYHLPRLDKMMMAHMVELRCPFLASNVIEDALSIPYSMRMGKQILKDQFRDIVPEQIINRPKQPLRFKKSSDWTLHLAKMYYDYCFDKPQNRE